MSSAQEAMVAEMLGSSRSRSNSGSTDSADIELELAELRIEVDGKNELITALVTELEQVVEQLDRLQRSGNEKPRPASSPGVSGSSMPSEILDEHHQVLGELHQAVQRFEKLGLSGALVRIESELCEMRSLMMGGAGGRPSHGNKPTSSQLSSSDRSLDDLIDRLSIGQSPAKNNSAADSSKQNSSSGPDNWERMKRKMLGEEPEELESTELDNQISSSESVDSGASDANLADSNPELNLLLTDPDLKNVATLKPIDVETATVEELRDACSDRDAYIIQLIRILRTRQAVTIPTNWDELASLPEEQKSRVDELVTRLEEQVRMAEVEISLDRARLSRERTQLQARQEAIEKQLKRLGLNSIDELENVGVESGSSTDRRWMRFLGVNRKG
ncbi:MAG: hypothetical protein FJ267_05930 [Planctomycetes bacterium]|nr:hypothetical protein [Planctomycetota bacterium]